MNLIHNHPFGTNVYEIVDEVPLGYTIWNIGVNAPEGYLPFCRLSRHQRFEGGRDIEIDTLKAMKVEGAQEILAAVSNGHRTIAEMERYIQKHRRPKTDCEQRSVALCRRAIPYMQKIKGIKNLSPL